MVKKYHTIFHAHINAFYILNVSAYLMGPTNILLRNLSWFNNLSWWCRFSTFCLPFESWEPQLSDFARLTLGVEITASWKCGNRMSCWFRVCLHVIWESMSFDQSQNDHFRDTITTINMKCLSRTQVQGTFLNWAVTWAGEVHFRRSAPNLKAETPSVSVLKRTNESGPIPVDKSTHLGIGSLFSVNCSLVFPPARPRGGPLGSCVLDNILK